MNDTLKLVIIVAVAGLIGGAIAYLGNQLGRYIGRKKLSVFKLRPRYTSILITVITGMMIAAVTLGASILISENVRKGLVEYHKLQNDITQLRTEYKKLQEDYAKKDIVYRYQDMIISVVVKPKPSKQEMLDALKSIVSKTNQVAMAKCEELAKKRGINYEAPKGGRQVAYISENLDEVADLLRRSTGEQIIFVRANSNVLLGDLIVVQVANPIPNRLVFKKGELISEMTVDSNEPGNVLWNQIYQIIVRDITPKALMKGILPNPETNTVGEIDPYYISEVVSRIKKNHKLVNLQFLAKNDTYLLGPLDLEVSITPEKE
ncbi:MAG: DUF3084 domain-containing protein [Firmicutes bacterium]|nr:DUF3084 domain-containing protein [Bacillota bacterium]